MKVVNKRNFENIINDKKEKFLSNLVMLGQIPAPSGEESKRAEYISSRFDELGLLDIRIDPVGNCSALMPGKDHYSIFVIASNMDTIFSKTINHNYYVTIDRIIGPGIANNSLGAVSIIKIAEILTAGNFQPDCDILFLELAKTVELGDNEGIKFFLKNETRNIKYFLFLESVELGRISFSSTGCARFSVHCETQEGSSFEDYGALNSIDIITELSQELLRIPITKRPRSSLNISMIDGGTAYSAIASDASLQFEIRSESNTILEEMKQKVKLLIEQLRFKYQTKINYKMFNVIKPHYMEYSHPFVQGIVELQRSLGLVPTSSSITSILAFPLEKGIPSIAVAIGSGKRSTYPEGFVFINSIFEGLLQVALIVSKFNSNYSGE